jgi:triosephosphate isomerase
MRKLIFAANWKMHLGPEAAVQFMQVFLQRFKSSADREVWFFPAAVSLKSVADLIRDRAGIRAGAQNVHWEKKGAFTGELSVDMVHEAGGNMALVGHSERRHVFGETDEETAKKVRALLEGRLTPLLCVGETIEQREAGETLSVVERQLGALSGLDSATLARIVIAYEPVWAIGTGKTATPADAAEVHAMIRQWCVDHGVAAGNARVLYGGSVKPGNVQELVSEPEIDGVLVGGASLDPADWTAIAQAGVD